MNKTIYLAGGCFWGTQKYLDGFEGVLETEVGYANGKSENPSYEEVCGGSDHAETVRVVYNDAKMSLEELLRIYFKVIDPVSVNRQGMDVGRQYRTGIYYTEMGQLPEILAVYVGEEAKAGEKLAVEVEPLGSFYPAEAYHQKYLDKNPRGYCHIPSIYFEMTKPVFRKAKLTDLDEIEGIYDRIHTEEEAGRVTIGWNRAIYPTRETAREAINVGEMFVETYKGKVVASARINMLQVPEYANANWLYEAKDDEVMVLHTLTIDPLQEGKGYAGAFVRFYEDYAKTMDCPYLRIDTNQINVRARAMYAKMGYREADIVDCIFNGIEGVHLVCLEKCLK